MEDTLDSTNDLQEEEVDGEVEKVLQEVAGEELAKLPNAGRTSVAAEPEKSEEVRLSGKGIPRGDRGRGTCLARTLADGAG